jgi:outer membrane lipoprotein-sorting protein
MPIRRAPATFIFFCLIVFGLSSCLARRRLITRKGGSTAQNLLVADRDTLLQAITRQYQAIHDFNATVDMVPALGTAEKSKITEYKDVRAYILFRKPADIRIIGLFPVVRNKAWDMISNGTDFKLYLPSQSRFIVGKNEIEQPSKNKLENLRPQHFLEALMVKPIDPAVDKILIENYTDEDNAYYILHIVRENGGGNLQLTRTIWFDRLKLQLARQMVLDNAGNILTDARYSGWQPYDNVPFPKHIEINRPRDEYAVVVDIVKMDINKGITDDKFVLDRPEGTTLQTIGAPAGAATPEAPKK